MKKSKFTEIIESICPSDLAEDWDNCGYQVNTEFQIGRASCRERV